MATMEIYPDFFVSLEGPGCYNHTKYSKITELHGYFITL